MSNNEQDRDIHAIDMHKGEFSVLANSIQNLAWMADQEGWIFWYNQRWYEYTGSTPEEMKGWGWQSVHDPEVLPFVLKEWKVSIATGQPFEMVFPLKGADGIFRSFLTRVLPVKNQEGNIIRWVGTNTDIHEQQSQSKNLERSIKESRILVDTILYYAPDAVITIDSDGNIISWNPEGELLFGWQESEVIGRKLVDTIIPNRYRDQHERGIQHFIATGEGPVINKPIEIYALRKDGSEFPVELKISFSKINERFLFIGFIRDISVRRRNEETIKNKTAQLIEAQELAHIGSWEWDVRSNKIEWSDELFRIFGLSPQQFESSYEHYLNYIHPDDRDYVNTVVNNAMETHLPYQFFHRVIRNDGIVRTISATGKVLVDEYGHAVRLAGTAQDVTKQKKYEQQLKEKNDQLIKMNQELQSFAYVSSHDLQEPLRKIQTFALRILEVENDNLSETGKNYFVRMQDAAARMQQLIADLLAYSRASSDERKFENIDLNLMLEEVLAEYKELIDEKNATITASEMCEARVIPFQFRQLLQNLVGNSLKFSRPGVNPRIEILSRMTKGKDTGLAHLDKYLEYCHIKIVDNGIGFEEAYSQKIFEVFQRLHGREVYSGTGIGLSIVKKIVENHNGFITAKGVLNQGATFDIYIPHL